MGGDLDLGVKRRAGMGKRHYPDSDEFTLSIKT